LERIQNAGPTNKRSQCDFGNAIVTYLGHSVGNGIIAPVAAKVDAILNFPKPVDSKQLRQFLGVIGYYRRYIPNMAQVCAPLTDLLKKGRVFAWDDLAEEAFVQVKSLLASKPILTPPDFGKPFIIFVDASLQAVGGILGQVNSEGLFKPICYMSKRLNKHQVRYSTVEKELYGLLLSVRYFGVYFCHSKAVIYSDHNPLVALSRMRDSNRKILRWILEIQEYNIEVKYKPGRENNFADILSRPS